MIQWLHGTQCGIALDSGHPPALISTWHGMPSAELIDTYYRWSDANAAATLAAEQQLVHIADLSRARWPSAAVRRRILDHASLDLATEVTLSTILVCGGAPDRLGSMARRMGGRGRGRHVAEVIVVESLGEAFELARERMWSARIPPPFGLDPLRYQTPVFERVR